ncbi:hypothetical protein MED15_02071 [Micromonospora noduli]|uniref:Uncharacterized protein n=1 Tax=Micromonospora noduli TaxID=709876 RepID=A0ABX9D591_9ACTN|nr:hypothetical protein MED15_02071 [Micromonospora noduli]
MSYDWLPVVSEPSGSAVLLRQMPNGLTPNFTHGFAALILLFISWISRLMLSRRQSARSVKPRLWVAKAASSGTWWVPLG